VAWVLVRLKVQLLRNGLRGSPLRAGGFILGCAYGVGLGVVAFAVLASLRSKPGDLGVVVELGSAVLVAAWAGLPLLGFGSDETLDPTRLALLPLDRRTLMTGLLGASLVGAAPLATAIGLAGTVFAASHGAAAGLLIAAAAALQLVLCVAVSRATVTWLSAALRSRRGRDFRILLVALIGVLPETVRFLLLGHVGITDLDALRPWAHAVSWVPAALPARAIVGAAGGHYGACAVELAGGAATLIALLALWSRSLDSVMTTPETPAGAAPTHATARGAGAVALFDPGLGLLPRTRTGAVAARELRYTWREPRRRVQLVAGVVLSAVLLGGVLTRGGLHHHDIVFAALLVAFISANNRALNQFGYDGPALWIHEAAGQDLHADLAGKNIAVALTSLPVTAVVAVALAAISGGWLELLMTLPLSLAVIGGVLGVGNVASILVPIPMPDTSGNVWGSQAGQGCTTGLLSMVVLAVEAVLLGPLAVALLVAQADNLRLIAVAAGLAYGALLHRAGTAIAVRVGRGRGAELLDAVGPRRAG
jgi:ABC-2 type transport system permease protein